MTREEAIKMLKKYAPRIKPFYEPYRTEYPQAIDMAIEALQFAEHFDLLKEFQSLQEVVRCKDCKYWQDNQEGHYPNELCPWDKGETPDDNGFCSFGERKDK